jgi:hypothetical protein
VKRFGPDHPPGYAKAALHKVTRREAGFDPSGGAILGVVDAAPDC